MLKLILLASLAFSAPAFARNSCTLKPSDLRSPLNINASNFDRKYPVRRNGNQISQTVILKGGQRLAYEAGGCEHYSYSFTYQNVPQNLNGIANKDLAALALVLLKSTPVASAKKFEKTTLIDGLNNGLAQGLINDKEIVVPCGDATCGLNSEGQNVVLNYMFAL